MIVASTGRRSAASTTDTCSTAAVRLCSWLIAFTAAGARRRPYACEEPLSTCMRCGDFFLWRPCTGADRTWARGPALYRHPRSHHLRTHRLRHRSPRSMWRGTRSCRESRSKPPFFFLVPIGHRLLFFTLPLFFSSLLLPIFSSFAVLRAEWKRACRTLRAESWRYSMIWMPQLPAAGREATRESTPMQ